MVSGRAKSSFGFSVFAVDHSCTSGSRPRFSVTSVQQSVQQMRRALENPATALPTAEQVRKAVLSPQNPSRSAPIRRGQVRHPPFLGG